ncbi:hypothetical protein [Paenibacillus elgii]|uniref:hypothetical protein n=1 Tax=Paenibacillus elgii TaxID=189691 RepID=UPI000248D21D|nr:hypothetical protein [Paenibacillus elgii]
MNNQKFKQIKEINGFPYNRLNEVWTIDEVNEEYKILKNGCLRLGVNDNEFKEFFDYVENNPTNTQCLFTNVELKEEIKVIKNGVATIVILSDGTKGVSKCLPEDEYDAEKGYEIALTKAKIKRLNKQLKKLIK